VQGRQIPREQILLPSLPPMSYAYCSDTAYTPSIAKWLKSVKVLYHEATFLNELGELAKETGHSTASDAAKIALDAEAGCLMLGHYSSRYKSLDELLQEAKVVFPHTILSQEGRQYKLREISELAGRQG
jgi:ribonuclease Z